MSTNAMVIVLAVLVVFELVALFCLEKIFFGRRIKVRPYDDKGVWLFDGQKLWSKNVYFIGQASVKRTTESTSSMRGFVEQSISISFVAEKVYFRCLDISAEGEVVVRFGRRNLPYWCILGLGAFLIFSIFNGGLTLYQALVQLVK